MSITTESEREKDITGLGGVNVLSSASILDKYEGIGVVDILGQEASHKELHTCRDSMEDEVNKLMTSEGAKDVVHLGNLITKDRTIHPCKMESTVQPGFKGKDATIDNREPTLLTGLNMSGSQCCCDLPRPSQQNGCSNMGKRPLGHNRQNSDTPNKCVACHHAPTSIDEWCVSKGSYTSGATRQHGTTAHENKARCALRVCNQGNGVPDKNTTCNCVEQQKLSGNLCSSKSHCNENSKTTSSGKHVRINDKSTLLMKECYENAVRSTPATRTFLRSRLRLLSLLTIGVLVVVTVAVGVSRLRVQPTVHVVFPATSSIRKVRMFSDYPDLIQLSKNYSSLNLVSRLQLLDAQRCQGDREQCIINVVCDRSTGQDVNCRCRKGYYFSDWKCKECTPRCQPGYFLLSQCSDISDAVCQPCKVCGPTEYAAASCNTKRNTICIDVSFPVKILPRSRSYLPDDGLKVTVSHSPNVFVERPLDMPRLETTMYVTNNQQSLDFIWPRMSGMDIAVKVSDVFLMPNYHDIESPVDDTRLFMQLVEPSQAEKRAYNQVQQNYCRHPVPDYYNLQLEVIKNRISAAEIITCDSQNSSLPRCPKSYKDGDRYLKWDINEPCPDFSSKNNENLKDRPNSVVCKEETDMLRKIFSSSRPTTEEWKFPSRDCEEKRTKCEQCLDASKCPADSYNATYGDMGKCCSAACYNTADCRTVYSPQCPKAKVECAKGEVNIFSLFPVFDSMRQQFVCLLKYTKPPTLYQISYWIRIPSVKFNTTVRNFVVHVNSRDDHEKKLARFDFIKAIHNSRVPLKEEIFILGDHAELREYQGSLMKPYTIRQLKTPEELAQLRRFSPGLMTPIQFEKPFLYSTLSWDKNGCDKNMSQIFPNQTLYTPGFIPVMAKQGYQELHDKQKAEFSYQLYRRDRAPYIKFFAEKGSSVLQFLQGTTIKGFLVANTLYGRVTWHYETATWKVVFSGMQKNCPSIISVKIFTQVMTGCAGHFDLFLNCPAEFSVTFNFSTGMSDLPDIFVLQVNDSQTSHHMVLSSVYAPIFVDEGKRSQLHILEKREGTEENEKENFVSIWLPVIFIVILTWVLLIGVTACYFLIDHRAKRQNYCTSRQNGGAETEATALNNRGEQQKNPVSVVSDSSQPSKCGICIFVVSYVVYSLVFTFTLTFAIVYLTHAPIWTSMTSSDYLGTELQTQVNRSLQEIQIFENRERMRLFAAYDERRLACVQHLELENKKLLNKYRETTDKQFTTMFAENGSVHILTDEIMKQNVSVYMNDIRAFLDECNKTVNSIVDRFQANYLQFLKSTVLNGWLKAPRRIFLVQDGEDPDRKFLSSILVKQFASWLEIDKVEELLAAKENVNHRLSNIPEPKISLLDVTFPYVEPGMAKDAMSLQHRPSNFEAKVEDAGRKTPWPDITNVSGTSGGSRRVRRADGEEKKEQKDGPGKEEKEDEGEKTQGEKGKEREQEEELNFGISGNLKHNLDHEASYQNGNQNGTKKKKSGDEVKDEKQNQAKKDKENEKSGPETFVEMVHPLPSPAELKKSANQDAASVPELALPTTNQRLRSESPDKKEDSAENTAFFYILIGVFLALDVVLWSYRFSWVSNQLYAIRHGYADRIPTDDACKQVLEIQTAYHLPAVDNVLTENSGFYVDGKEPLYNMDQRETDMTFLNTNPKLRDDILLKIWNEKMYNREDPKIKRNQTFFLVRWVKDVRDMVQRFFLSQLVWQACVTFMAITFICLCVYCLEFWLTPDNFRTLVGGQSATADIQWNLDSSGRYLQGLAGQLTKDLARLQRLCDAEVNMLTDAYYAAINMQTSAFTASLQRLCAESQSQQCAKMAAFQTTGGRIVGCNFLPIQAQTYQDLSLSHMEDLVFKEVTPFLTMTRHAMATSTSLVIALLCCRLLCQAGALTLRHYLLVTGHLPRVKVYQSEEPTQTLTLAPGAHGSGVMQRSQSWVDSCESGVYVGESEEAPNKEENR